MNYRAKTLYKNRIAEEYDKERFSSFKGRTYDFFEQWSVGRAISNFPKGSLVLDIPCGTGRVSKYLYDLGYNVIGADISPDMLDIAKNKYPIPFVQKDIEHIDYKDNSFDVIVCVRMMGHLPYENKIRALYEMKRIAKNLIVTFYFKEKPEWYHLTPLSYEVLLGSCGLKIKKKHPICPSWSDGVTYLLNE